MFEVPPTLDSCCHFKQLLVLSQGRTAKHDYQWQMDKQTDTHLGFGHPNPADVLSMLNQ